MATDAREAAQKAGAEVKAAAETGAQKAKDAVGK